MKMAKCKECVHYGVCLALLGKQEVRIVDNVCSFAEKCVAYKHMENYVEVVRCKDCKRCKHYGDDVYGCRGFGMMKVKPDGFCSYGERKDNDNP
jgi:hypothetical protein